MPAPDDDLALLTDAAREAGRIALRYWRKSPDAWEKADGAGPVTEADLAVNRMLAQELRAARPDYGWLSEESEDDPARLEAEHVFIIDPIDGTRAFLRGEDTFAHSLAIARRGRVVAAAVFLPALGRFYSASLDTPAQCDGAPLAVSPATRADGATLLTSQAGLRPGLWPGGVPAVRRSFHTSLAYRLCLVAEGRYDAAITLRDAFEWDIAAGDLIARQAGATVSDKLGRPLAYNAPTPRAAGMLAAPPKLHAALMTRLSVASPPGSAG
ncbi:inositol monophosphatase [Defluviimonas sp. 20V17]|uniref:3'(2'),5'-bisphosphate nucleotidase CysQ n=1 Tax=Allgaiera indica TaxID=765699 RepID=A0AAN4UNF3_9RHOB|nr:3'(2'),5'-bisphosphate nucleotidase CysQ [Allgaiera indica]KDB02747.1 inositol monophosphatase [Defluviimonas sp. 20V17]GHD98715.1 3'(2'),5'-bisphosphate nucleotidase CysQ [Allgaiera indica]SDW07790.1 myo-inositol-1(or 4)-monophosphatase [Allgaiera indica]